MSYCFVEHTYFEIHLIHLVVYSNGNDGIIDRGQLLFPLYSMILNFCRLVMEGLLLLF